MIQLNVLKCLARQAFKITKYFWVQYYNRLKIESIIIKQGSSCDPKPHLSTMLEMGKSIWQRLLHCCQSGQPYSSKQLQFITKSTFEVSWKKIIKDLAQFAMTWRWQWEICLTRLPHCCQSRQTQFFKTVAVYHTEYFQGFVKKE